MLTSGYDGPIACVHPKNGKRFLEESCAIKEPLDIVFKKIGKWKYANATTAVSYTQVLNDAEAATFRRR